MPENNNKAPYLIGVDLGGTKILAGVFDTSFNCLGQVKISTKAHRGPDEVIERIVRCVRDAVDECDLGMSQVRGVGIGAPGAVDTEEGRVIFAPNLGWENLPLKKNDRKAARSAGLHRERLQAPHPGGL